MAGTFLKKDTSQGLSFFFTAGYCQAGARRTKGHEMNPTLDLLYQVAPAHSHVRGLQGESNHQRWINFGSICQKMGQHTRRQHKD